jgi:hypothetical protein
MDTADRVILPDRSTGIIIGWRGRDALVSLDAVGHPIVEVNPSQLTRRAYGTSSDRSLAGRSQSTRTRL